MKYCLLKAKNRKSNTCQKRTSNLLEKGKHQKEKVKKAYVSLK